jgi:cytochrome P450
MGKVLAEHPDQRQELVDERSLIPVAIEELLRYEPPGPHVARYVAAKDVEFQGQTVTTRERGVGVRLVGAWRRIS